MRKVFDPRYRAVIERLVAARRKLDLNQTELGQRIGRPQLFVSRYETGERRLDFIEFFDVARALELDPGELLAQSQDFD